jgi:DNA adenine methylase
LQPFIKWAGGKRWLAAKVKKLAGEFQGRYYEPFLGGGAVFFHLLPEQATLSDLNQELITTYKVVRSHADSVTAEFKRHVGLHSNELYYRMRALKPGTDLDVAVRFLYLNRTCWNGLYRVNRRGEFNVPRGTKSAIIQMPDELSRAARALKNVEIVACDFQETIEKAGRGDLVYVDPPYTVKHNLNGFLKYNEIIFGWDDQVRLKKACLQAQARGATVVVSNADHGSIAELYAEAESISVKRASVISGKPSGRSVTTEFVGILRGAQ